MSEWVGHLIFDAFGLDNETIPIRLKIVDPIQSMHMFWLLDILGRLVL